MKKSLLRYDDNIRFYVKENSWIARLAAIWLHSPRMAIVIGKTVHLYHVTTTTFLENKRWVRHEMTHIRQFRRYGFFRFIFLYLSESVKHGYYQNRFETEARTQENTITESEKR